MVLWCRPVEIRDVGAFSELCHNLQLFGGGVLSKTAPASPGIQAQMWADPASPGMRNLLGCAPGLQETSAAVHMRSRPSPQVLDSDELSCF